MPKHLIHVGRILLVAWTLAAAPAALGAIHAATGSTRTAERIRAFEAHAASIPLPNGQAPITFDLASLVSALRTPGSSIAVIDHFDVAWTRAHGVTEPPSSTPVTAHTLFQAASINKTLTAVAAMRPVERGKRSLDEGVNRKLTSSRVPGNEFPRDQKVT